MRLDLQDSFNTWKTNPLKNKNSGNSEEKRGDIFGRGFKKNQSPLYPRKKKQILPRQRKMGKPEKMKNGGKHCRHYFRTHYRGYSEEPPVISRWHRKTFTNPFKNQEWGGEEKDSLRNVYLQVQTILTLTRIQDIGTPIEYTAFRTRNQSWMRWMESVMYWLTSWLFQLCIFPSLGDGGRLPQVWRARQSYGLHLAESSGELVHLCPPFSRFSGSLVPPSLGLDPARENCDRKIIKECDHHNLIGFWWWPIQTSKPPSLIRAKNARRKWRNETQILPSCHNITIALLQKKTPLTCFSDCPPQTQYQYKKKAKSTYLFIFLFMHMYVYVYVCIHLHRINGEGKNEAGHFICTFHLHVNKVQVIAGESARDCCG